MGANPPGAGQMRERITVQTKKVSPDGYGGQSSKWTTLLSGCPARITPMLRGGESFISRGLQGIAVYEIWIRCSSETDVISVSDQIKNERNGELYDIKLIQNEDEKHRFYYILAQTGTAS